MSDRVVLVTGSGKGTGRSLSLTFAQMGFRVAINDISPLHLDQLSAEIANAGAECQTCNEDVAKKIGVQAAINQIVDTWGRIDVLINCANVEPHYPLIDIDEWDWHRVLDVNLTGAAMMMQSVGRVMRSQNGGVIVNVINLAPGLDQPDHSAYLASRAALIALTRYAAPEFAKANIRLHAVCTGLPEFHQSSINADSITNAVAALIDPINAHLAGQIVNIA